MYLLLVNSDFIFFLEILALLNLECWPYIAYSNELFVSATSPKLLQGI